MVGIYPDDVMNINNFRDTVIEYFEKKTAVIEKVIRCDIVNFCQEKYYSEPVGMRRIVRGCKDLYNCGDPQGKGLQ